MYADKPPFTSSSEESNPALRHKIGTESDFNPFSEEGNSRQSARTLPEAFQTLRPETSGQETESQSSLDEFSTPPQTGTKPRRRPKGSKNLKRII